MVMTENKKNSLWLAIQYSASVIFAFITLKMNISHFGNELFGMWLLFASLWGVGTAVDFGFGTAIIKYVAEAKNNNDEKRLISLISTGFVTYCLLGVIIFIFGNIISWFVYFNNSNIVPAKFYSTARIIFAILGVNFYLQYLTTYYKSVLEGISAYALSSKLILVYNIFILLSVLMVKFLDLSIVVLSISYAASSLLLIILNLITIRRKYPLMKVKISRLDFNLVKKLLKFCVSMQLATIFAVTLDPIIKYIIGNYANLGVIPIYEIARKFATAVSGLFYATFRNLLPKASILKTREEYLEHINNECINISKYGIVYSGVVFGIASVIMAFVMNLWFGYTSAVMLYLLLCLPESINNYGYAIYIFLIGIGKTNFIAFVQLINIVVTTVSVILGYYIFHNNFGLLGYYLSVILVNILMLIYAKRFVGFSIRNLMKKVGMANLLLLNILLVLTVTAAFYNFIPLYLLLALLSVISIFIFYGELKNLSSILLSSLTSRRSDYAR